MSRADSKADSGAVTPTAAATLAKASSTAGATRAAKASSTTGAKRAAKASSTTGAKRAAKASSTTDATRAAKVSSTTGSARAAKASSKANATRAAKASSKAGDARSGRPGSKKRPTKDGVGGPSSPVGDAARPYEAAQVLNARLFTQGGLQTLWCWQGEFHRWNGTHFVVQPTSDMRALIYEEALVSPPKAVDRRTVDNLFDALRAVANLSHLVVRAMPAFHPTLPSDPAATEVIPVRNGLLCIADERLLPPTPRYFAPFALPFEYSPGTPSPAAWLAFLQSVWPDDPESIECLQEMVGLLLCSDTSHQKGFLFVGPKRSGKGTIARLIVALLGSENVASPTLQSLGQPFGLQSLIGKTAAIVSDARLGSRADIAAISENVLRLTGEDSINVERKFMPAYTARLVARLVVFSNELPTFRDASNALASRFVILRMQHSFFGREDHGLEGRLIAELPSILLWALTGLRRLRQRGKFVQPKSSTDAIELMEDLGSPISAWLRDRCELGSGKKVLVRDLFADWILWCKDQGRDMPGTVQTFARDLLAAVPQVTIQRASRAEGQTRPREYSGIGLLPVGGSGAATPTGQTPRLV